MIGKAKLAAMVGRLLWIVLVAQIVWADSQVRLDLREFVRMGLERDPRMAENRYEQEEKVKRLAVIRSGVVLPRFEASMAWGPSPGLRRGLDLYGDTVDIYDFSKIGPYFGTELKVAQPLNWGQFQTGLKAAQADLRQKRWEIQHREVRKAMDLQEFYYGFLLARELHALALEAKSQMDRAMQRIEDALDEDEPGFSQTDLLELKAGYFEVEKAVADAENGMKKARLAIRFALSLSPDQEFIPLDTLLLERPEPLPPLDTLLLFLQAENPELRRLEAGLEAKAELAELARVRMGPEFFVFGNFRYAKSWAGDRSVFSRDAFSQDPVNTIDGSVGLGVRYRINFWDGLSKYRLARVEYRQLRYKENYALDGLRSLVEEQYGEVQTQRTKLASARSSLRATEALLKGAAIQFDVDPSNSARLISAFRRNIMMRKDFYYALYHYNLAVAELWMRIGWTPDAFYSNYLGIDKSAGN